MYLQYRFLKPSQVRGIDTEAFMRQQLIASNIHEQTILGYRGLVGKNQIIIFVSPSIQIDTFSIHTLKYKIPIQFNFIIRR